MTGNTGRNRSPRGWRIGDWTVDPEAGEVERNGQTLRLEPKVMAVLACLARRAGQVVSKEELLQEVWPNTHVEDVALARSVSEIRRALGDDPRDPRYVETLARRGYRLVADVHPLGRSVTGRLVRWQVLVPAVALPILVLTFVFFRPATERTLAEPLSIAVLPFENFGEPAQDYLADGLTEDVIASLSAARDLRVISRTSTMAYKNAPRNVRDIGAELGVSAVLEGSVRREGDQIIVVGQLIDTRTDDHLWAETIERNVVELHEVQHEIAAQIATALHVRLAPPAAGATHRPPPEVYDLYLRGRTEYERRDPETLPLAVELLREATEREPEFALAHAALGDALARTYQASRDTSAIEGALAAAQRAIELEPELAEGHKALGFAWAVIGRNRLAAESYERAIARRPGYWQAVNNLAIVFHNTGQLDRAYRWMREAVLLDPMRATTRGNLGETLSALTFDEEARQWLEYALTLEPHYAGAHDGLAALDIYGGRLAEARRRMEAELALEPACRACLLKLALVAQLDGRDDEAEPYVDRILGMPGSRATARIWKARIRRGDGPPTRDLDLVSLMQEFQIYVRDGDEHWATRRSIALAAAVIGDDDAAIDWYTRAVDAGLWNYRLDEIEPAFRWIRDDPRFEAQLQRVRDRVATSRAAVTRVLRPGER